MAANYPGEAPVDWEPKDEKRHDVSQQSVEAGSDGGEIMLDNLTPEQRAMERGIVRKFDLILIPTLSLMYLLNAMDKSNLGNAKTNGIDDDLHFTGNQYNILLSTFYIPLILFCTPQVLLVKKFGAKYVLPLSMVVYGSMTMCAASATNFGGLVACRMILGVAESGFLPGVIFYLTTFYKREELAKRLCTFYAATEIAGAFTGLIAFGVFQIDSNLRGWQYLFLIEGAITVVVGITALFVLPKSAATAYFLSNEEKRLAYARIKNHSSTEVDSEYSFRRGAQVFREFKVWPFFMLLGFCVCVPLFSESNFLPQIVRRLGYSPVKTNLYTVAPHAVGAVCVVLMAVSSDYFTERSIHVAIPACVTATGFILLSTIDPAHNLHVGYFACFLITMGGHVTSPIWSTWYSNNLPDENQRALLTPIFVAVANCSAFVASNIFAESTAPNYIMASITCACFGFFAAGLSVCLGLWMKYDNLRRDREQGVHIKAGDIPTSELSAGMKDPKWRWMGVLK